MCYDHIQLFLHAVLLDNACHHIDGDFHSEGHLQGVRLHSWSRTLNRLHAIASRRMRSVATGCHWMLPYANAYHRMQTQANVSQNLPKRPQFFFPKKSEFHKALFIYYLLSFIYGGQKAPVYRRSRSLVGRFLGTVGNNLK